MVGSGPIQTVLSFRHDTSADYPPRLRTTSANLPTIVLSNKQGLVFCSWLSAPPFEDSDDLFSDVNTEQGMPK